MLEFMFLTIIDDCICFLEVNEENMNNTMLLDSSPTQGFLRL